MTRFQKVTAVASIFASLALGASATAFANPEAGAAVAQGQEGHGRHGHHGKRGDLLRASLRLESLTPAQKQQIEALVAQEKAAHANVRVARGQLMQAIAGGVDSGNVDANTLKGNVQAVESAIAANEPGDRATLEKLHAILTPAQRAELVTRLESHGKRGEWNKGDAAKQGEHKAHEGMRGGPLGALNLTAAQKQQIFANLKSQPQVDRSVWQDARANRQRLVEAFKADRFVMNELTPPKDPRAVDAQVERMVNLAKAAAPVLTPEQRAMASAKLRAMAAHESK